MKIALFSIAMFSIVSTHFITQAEAHHYRGHEYRRNNSNRGHADVHVHHEGDSALASSTLALYGTTLTDLSDSMNRKEIADVILKDADLYNSTGYMGPFLAQSVKDIQLENSEVSDDEAVLSLVELALSLK